MMRSYSDAYVVSMNHSVSEQLELAVGGPCNVLRYTCSGDTRAGDTRVD